MRYLHLQLRERQINKTYHAIVAGLWPKELKKVNYPLEKSVLKSGERISIVSEQGKPSLTRYKLLDSFQEVSLIEASPSTGRTHQIRVHCAASGHVICGDRRYDIESHSPFNERLFLHAQSIEFKETPESEPLIISAEVDSIWQKRLQSLESKNL